MWELDCEESRAPKNWCFWTVVLEKTLESPLDCKIKLVHPKGDQSWIYTGSTDAEAEAPILQLPDAESWLVRLMLGKTEGRRRRGQQRVKWLGGIHGHEFEQTSGEREGRGSLVFCSRRERHDLATEQQLINDVFHVFNKVKQIRVSVLFQNLFPFRLLQNIEQSSLSSLIIYFKCNSVYMSVLNSQLIPSPFPQILAVFWR